MPKVSILDKTVCIHLACTMWCGQTRLLTEDLGLRADQIPPKDLASLGSLKLCDPKRLTPLKSIKRAAERDCARRSVRFLGGYATDESNLDTLMGLLAERKRKFEKQTKGFVAALKLELDEWASRHAEWDGALRRAEPNLSYVASRFSFEFHAFRVRGATDDEASAEEHGLVAAANGLSAQLFREIQVEANATWRKSYEGKDAVGQKALRPIRAIREKLDALRFIDTRIRPMIDQIDTVLGSLPTHGELASKDYMAVVGLLGILGDPDQLVRHGVRALENAGSKVPVAKAVQPNTQQRRSQGSHWF